MKTSAKILVGSMEAIIILLAFFVLLALMAPLANAGAAGLQVPAVPAVDQLLSGLPVVGPLIQPAPATPTAPAAGTGTGYGGYSNGGNAQASLPLELGGADVGLATGGINSSGGIVPDWPGTTQDESKATSAGVVEAVGIRALDAPLSIGSAGSSALPETGLIGRLLDLPVPGIGRVQIGMYKTHSGSGFTQNEMTVLMVNAEALDLNLAIPVAKSTDTTLRNGSEVQSAGTTTLIGAGPGQTLDIGENLADGKPALGVLLLDAGSVSRANGTTAGNANYWTLGQVDVGGSTVLNISDRSGAFVAGATLIPAPAKNEALLAIDPLPGVAGAFIGETWSETDGKTYAFGGANIVCVSLLDDPSFLILGHAGSGANAVSATGPGSGADQAKEGPPGSNIPPADVSPPNDMPIAPGGGEEGIGPGPDPGDGTNPLAPPATTVTYLTPAYGGSSPLVTTYWTPMTQVILPNTGFGIVLMGFMVVLAGAALLISGPVAKRIKGFMFMD